MVKKILLLTFGLGVFLVGGTLLIVYLVHLGSLKRSPGYRAALAQAQSSAQLRELLGPDWSPNWMVSGLDLDNNQYGYAQFSFAVSGSKGSGRIFSVVHRARTGWQVEGLALYTNDARRIDLLPPVDRDPLLNVPGRKVYLVPLGSFNVDSIQTAPDYYRRKYGVAVEILPRIPGSASLETSDHRELVDDRIFELLQRTDAAQTTDPDVAVIVLTNWPIFMASNNWHGHFNVRQGNLAVVTSAGMAVRRPFESANPEVARVRFRKALTRNVAMLAFRLPMSEDDGSLLSAIPSPIGLDEVGEDLTGSFDKWQPETSPYIGFGMIQDPSAPKPFAWELGGTAGQGNNIGAQAEQFAAQLPEVTFSQVDFSLPGKQPLRFFWSLESWDKHKGAFGIGSTDSLDCMLGTNDNMQTLKLTDGTYNAATFHRVGPDATWSLSVGFEDDNGARLTWNTRPPHPGEFTAKYPSGDIEYYLPCNANEICYLSGLIDESGTEFAIERDGYHARVLESVTGNDGRWIHFTHNEDGFITEAADNTGRKVRYSYTPDGRLQRTQDNTGKTTNLSYDADGRLLKVTDEKGQAVVTNEYDGSGMLVRQRFANGEEAVFRYTRGTDRKLESFTVEAPNHQLYTFHGENGQYALDLPVMAPQAAVAGAK